MTAEDMIKTGLLGHPVAHSKSPDLHNGWFKQYEINGVYRAIDCLPDKLDQTVKRLIDEGYRGFNITIPHKQAIMVHCAEIDDLAKAVGAVNTVTIKDGRLCGTNTDVFGFVENIRQNAAGFDFKDKTVVVLGAGGAARAVVHGLLSENVAHVIITNRTRENAEDIKETCADPARVTVSPWDDRASVLSGCDLLVNTTSLGMDSMPPLGIALDHLPKTAVVNDIVYKPLMSNLLVQAKNHGNPIVTGIGMLHHQARKAFEIWIGILPE